MTGAELAERVGAKRSGTEWKVRCPADEDRNPSLSIADGDKGGAVVHCHAGCAPGAVVAAFGLTMKDLAADSSNGHAETIYRYPDEVGTLLFEVVRLPGKKFHQRPANGRRGPGAVKDVRLVPYNLPRVLKAVANGDTVYICEGEKDADRVIAEGRCATTNPMGAGKWIKVRDLAREVLGGATVVVVQDNDETGRKHALEVVRSLRGFADSVEWREPIEGCKDVSDHLAAGHSLDDLIPVDFDQQHGSEKDKPARQIDLRPASSFKLRRVRWLWDGRIALGTLALLAGPEGLGKSTIGYWLAARITRGELPGELAGTPKSVLVCATEDSWEFTIAPRLLAHGADLDRVFRIGVNDRGLTYGLTLPSDIPATIEAAQQVDAVLLILDPLISRLGDLDTHRDSEVRQALEPLAEMGDRIGLSVLGLIHHNKSGSSDPLNLVMASKAFTAVARSVHTAIWDPENGEGEHRRLFGTPKNNLGATDLPTLSYTVVKFYYPTDDGIGQVGQIEWGAEVAGSIADAIRRSDETSEYKTEVADAAEWLRDYLTANGPEVLSASVKDAAKAAGHAPRTLHRARQKLGVQADTTSEFPRRTFWTLPVVPLRVGRHINGTTDTTGCVNPQVDPSCASCASGAESGMGGTDDVELEGLF